MEDAFSRRGFARLAVLGTAGLWAPRLGAAQALPRLEGRFVASQDMRVELFVRNHERQGIELLANALRLEGELRAPDAEPSRFTLSSTYVETRSRSRAGFRLGAKLALPPGEERLYDVFQPLLATAFPRGVSGTLTLHALLGVALESRPANERPGLQALAALEGSLPVAIPS